MTTSPTSKPTPRETILTMLEEAGNWLSGEILSERLGISRAAVGKHVTALRNEGHAIDAATRKGYKLLARRDPIQTDRFANFPGTNVFGKNGWSVWETTTSTNLQAAHLAEEDAAEGHVVVAEKQTKGRGRKGHDWFVMPRSLQFSVLLYPRTSFWDAQAFTLAGAQAVAAAVQEQTGLNALVKLPNDILVNGKKICGVLVETGYRGEEPEWAVIGVGCNVNAIIDDIPAEARKSITSLLVESGAPVDRNALLAAMLHKLEAAYERIGKGKR